MAKKAAPTPQLAIEKWQEVTQRASLSDYRNVNGVIIGTSAEGKLVLMIPDPKLLTLLLDESGENKIIAYDRDDRETADYLPWFDYGLKLDDGWLELDGEKLFAGQTVIVKLSDDHSKNFISKDSLPLKLRKVEFTELGYRVFTTEKVLAIKKRFEVLPEYGFVVLKLFQII